MTLAVLIVYFVGRKILRFLISPNENFGNSLTARLIGLAVAVIVLPTVIPSVFQTFAAAAAQLITGIRMLFYNLRDSINLSCDNPEAQTGCFGQMGSGFVETATGITGTILLEIRNLPVNRIIGFLAIWVLISLLLDDDKKSDGGGQGLSSLKKLYINRNLPVVRNTVFFLILAASSYLCMAAILAIPELEAKSILYQEVGIEKLKVQLDDQSNTLSNYPVTFAVEKPEFFNGINEAINALNCLLYTSPSPRDS